MLCFHVCGCMCIDNGKAGHNVILGDAVSKINPIGLNPTSTAGSTRTPALKGLGEGLKNSRISNDE